MPMRSLHSDISAYPSRNQNPYPLPDASNIDFNSPWGSGQATAMSLSLQAQAWGSCAAMRATLTNATIAVSIRMGFNSTKATVGWNTYRYRVRAAPGLVGKSVDSRIRYGGSTTNIHTKAITLTAEWQEIVTTVSLGTAAPDASVQIIMTANTGVNGDWIEVTALEWVAERGIRGAYADGNTPGWKWDGTANASSSVGYPNLLSTVIGRQPYLELAGIGTISRADKIDFTEDRTLFSIFEFTQQTLFAQVARLSNSANNNHNSAIYGHNTTSGVFGRVQTAATTSGVDYRDVTVAGPRTNGRHVGCLMTTGAMTAEVFTATSNVTGLILSASAAIPVGAQHQANVLTGTLTADGFPVYQWAFRGSFSTAERDAAIRWIANAYGVPPLV